MSDLEELRRKKLEELQQQSESGQQQQEQMAQQLQALENIVKQKLTKEALERYSNIKIAHPETAMQLLAVLGQYIQSGHNETITDEQLKELLTKIQTKKREINIRRV